MNTSFFRRIGSLILGLFALSMPLIADAEAEEIIRKVDEVQKSDTEVASMTMTVVDDTADPGSSRSFEAETIGRGADESVIVFRSPRRLAGLSILSRDDGQWVYFPSTGRVRKLSGAAKSESVSGVGGDFSYEDLGGGEWSEDYRFRLVSEESDAWILEGTPKDDEISYSGIEMTVAKADYIPRRIVYYKGSSSPEKVLTVEEVGKFDGRLKPARMVMENPAKNSRTEIEFTRMEFGTPLADERFHPRLFYR